LGGTIRYAQKATTTRVLPASFIVQPGVGNREVQSLGPGNGCKCTNDAFRKRRPLLINREVTIIKISAVSPARGVIYQDKLRAGTP